MAATEAPASAPRRGRRRRLAWRLLGAGALAWGLAIAGGMNPSVPSDFVLNLLPVPAVDPRLRAPAGGRTLVALQHGMWRSAWALWRFERALRAHGYEVLNVSYPSTARTIEAHAAALHAALRAHVGAAPPADLRVCFVGHSMGGLVIRSYLSRADALPAAACVFIATPHRGAQLARVHRATAAFRWLLGQRAAAQLVPGDAFYAGLRPLAGMSIGSIIGGKGDEAGYSNLLAGDDDGTVTVAEAHCEGETDSVLLPLGHTRIGMADATIVQLLRFLAHGRFAP